VPCVRRMASATGEALLQAGPSHSLHEKGDTTVKCTYNAASVFKASSTTCKQGFWT